jgi:hypothetical protein
MTPEDLQGAHMQSLPGDHPFVRAFAVSRT